MTQALGDALLVCRPTAWLHEAADAAARVSSELLFGESVTVLADKNGWYRVKTARDGYKGWARCEVFAAPADAAQTHLISVPSTLVYLEPDFHTAPSYSLPLNARVSIIEDTDNGIEDTDNGIEDTDNGFVKSANGDYLCKQHVSRAAEHTSALAIAKQFLGTPYAWAGRTWRGIDCSGLVQQSLWACGKECPRDSGDQWKTLGTQLLEDDTPQEGDLVFFPGHVGFYLGGGYLLHANATHMACTIDPLKDVISWSGKDHPAAPLKGFKRL